MKKITNRDLRAYFIGLLSALVLIFVLDLIFDWTANAKAFKEGVKDGVEELVH